MWAKKRAVSTRATEVSDLFISRVEKAVVHKKFVMRLAHGFNSPEPSFGGGGGIFGTSLVYPAAF